MQLIYWLAFGTIALHDCDDLDSIEILKQHNFIIKPFANVFLNVLI